MGVIWTPEGSLFGRQARDIRLADEYADAAMVVLPRFGAGRVGIGGPFTVAGLSDNTSDAAGIGVVTASGSASHITSGRSVAGWTAATVVVVQRRNNNTAGWHNRLQASGASTSHWPYTGVNFLSTFATARWVNGTTPVVDINLVSSVVITARTGDHRAYENGVLFGSSTGETFGIQDLTLGDSGAWSFSGATYLFVVLPRVLPDKKARSLSVDPWQMFEPAAEPIFYSLGGGATDYPVTATDALTLADSASQSFAATVVATDAVTLSDSAAQSFSATGVAAEAMTLADSASNVAALGAAASDALTLADSATNVAALSATATDALTLADTLNATASGDYTATSSDALTLADSASNVAALGATGSDALTLADAASNVAALGAAASDALTLADTLNASASGDYVVVATDALSLSDSVVAAYAAICIATDALTLADATSAAMAGEYAATATDALTLADAASNAAALGVSISEALTLAALVSAMLTGNTALTGKRGGYGVQMQLAARRAQIQTGRCRN